MTHPPGAAGWPVPNEPSRKEQEDGFATSGVWKGRQAHLTFLGSPRLAPESLQVWPGSDMASQEPPSELALQSSWRQMDPHPARRQSDSRPDSVQGPAAPPGTRPYVPHSLATGSSLHSASMTFPEF